MKNSNSLTPAECTNVVSKKPWIEGRIPASLDAVLEIEHDPWGGGGSTVSVLNPSDEVFKNNIGFVYKYRIYQTPRELQLEGILQKTKRLLDDCGNIIWWGETSLLKETLAESGSV